MSTTAAPEMGAAHFPTMQTDQIKKPGIVAEARYAIYFAGSIPPHVHPNSQWDLDPCAQAVFGFGRGIITISDEFSEGEWNDYVMQVLDILCGLKGARLELVIRRIGE